MFAAAVAVLSSAAAAPAQLAPALQYVWGTNLAAFNKEDVDGVMATVDTRSPDFGPTRAALDALFKDRDLKAELVDFVLMGHDDEFAVARVKTRTAGQPGSDFATNIVDAVVLFHQENGTWKLWSEEIVAVEMVP
jgi:hypothetical protein